MIITDKHITAVIPAFNEGDKVFEVIQKTKAFVSHVIVINDHSSDNTSNIAKSTGVEVIDLEKNYGAGYATRHGCDIAISRGTDIIVTLDGDGQHSPDDIPSLIAVLIKKNHDIVFGYRIQNKKMPLVKALGNRIISFLILKLYNIKLKDSLTGFHAFTSDSYPNIRWDSNRYEFIVEFAFRIYKNKLSYGESLVKTIYFQKEKGMKKRDGLKAIIKIFKWKFF